MRYCLFTCKHSLKIAPCECKQIHPSYSLIAQFYTGSLNYFQLLLREPCLAVAFIPSVKVLSSLHMTVLSLQETQGSDLEKIFSNI